jgi:hypothetical protein
MSHGEPIKGQKDVLYIWDLFDLREKVRINKVAMIGKPTDTENDDQNDQHLYNLWMGEWRQR